MLHISSWIKAIKGKIQMFYMMFPKAIWELLATEQEEEAKMEQEV